MTMCHSSREAALSSIKLSLISGLLMAAACASRPAAAPATESSSAALTQASTGVAEQQASQQPAPDDIVFVEREHKEPATHDDAAPATSLRVETSGRKQHLGQLKASE
jgi:hypothetical protein